MMSQTSLNSIEMLPYGRLDRRLVEEAQPYCTTCDKAIGHWGEPELAQEWLAMHWRKKHDPTKEREE